MIKTFSSRAGRLSPKNKKFLSTESECLLSAGEKPITQNPIALDTLTDTQLKKLVVLSHYCFNSVDLCVYLLIEMEKRRLVNKDSYKEYIKSLRLPVQPRDYQLLAINHALTNHRALLLSPTASGKSSFAIKLAKKINGEIINADSMQVYKELKILSARPDQKDYKKIKHCLLYTSPSPRDS